MGVRSSESWDEASREGQTDAAALNTSYSPHQLTLWPLASTDRFALFPSVSGGASIRVTPSRTRSDLGFGLVERVIHNAETEDVDSPLLALDRGAPVRWHVDDGYSAHGF